ncbi:hypothetical protein D3C76_962070 [compost metagenome]
MRHRQGVPGALELGPDAGAQHFSAVAQQVTQLARLTQLQGNFADDAAQHLGTAPNQLKRLVEVIGVELVGLSQVCVQMGGVGLGEGFAQQRERRDAGPVERLVAAEYQVGELVAIGAGEHQPQAAGIPLTSLVELVAGSLEAEHRVDPGLGGQGMLGFVDHQHHGFTRGTVQQLQRLGQRRPFGQLRLAEIPGQRAQEAEFVDAHGFGELADALFIRHQCPGDGRGDQVGRVLLLVGPKVDVDREPTSRLAFGNQVFAQECTFSGTPWRGQEQA